MVETKALRRSDDLKTALLRAVSHDLRSPLTAIAAAGEALESPHLAPGEREELAAAVVGESARMSRLVDKLLDLSRLQGGAAEPRAEWCSVEEVLRDRQNGLLVDFFDGAALTDRVDEALDHPDGMQDLRDRARRTVVDGYDLRTVTLPRHLALIDDLIARRTPR